MKSHPSRPETSVHGRPPTSWPVAFSQAAPRHSYPNTFLPWIGGSPISPESMDPRPRFSTGTAAGYLRSSTQLNFASTSQGSRDETDRETVMSCNNGARGPGGRGSRPVDFWATGTVLSDWPGPAGREEEPTLGSLPKIAGEEKRARGKCSVGAPQLESPSSQSASSASARLPHPSFSRPPHHHSTYPSPSPRIRPDHVPVMRVSCPTKSKFDSLRDVCKSA